LGKVIKPFAVSLLPCILAGCAQLSPSFDDMSKTYQITLEKYERSGLFLNVVRASKKLPLSFLSIPSITGTGSVGETAGVSANVVSAIPSTTGGFLSAASGTYYTPTLGITLNRSFTFTQSSMDNAVFQKSFISEIPLATVNSVANQPDDKRELIYSMIIDRLLVVEPNGTTKRLINSPLDPGYEDFQNKLHELIEMGLSTEMLQYAEAVGTPMTASQVNDIMFKYLDVKEEKQLSMKEVIDSHSNKKTYQMYQRINKARFCFEKTKHTKTVSAKYGNELICHDKLDTKNEDISATINPKQTDKNEHELGITIRSTASVFTYLGDVLSSQTRSEPKIPMLWSSETIRDGQFVPSQKNIPILIVQKNKPNGRVFSEIDFEGDSYYIPAENAGHSTQVMSLLTGIIALNKVPGAIPQSPTVLIK
jgi:hypothetical protein